MIRPIARMSSEFTRRQLRQDSPRHLLDALLLPRSSRRPPARWQSQCPSQPARRPDAAPWKPRTSDAARPRSSWRGVPATRPPRPAPADTGDDFPAILVLPAHPERSEVQPCHARQLLAGATPQPQALSLAPVVGRVRAPVGAAAGGHRTSPACPSPPSGHSRPTGWSPRG